LVLQLIQTDNIDNQFLEKHQELFQEIRDPEKTDDHSAGQPPLKINSETGQKTIELERIEEIGHVAEEEESLSLEDNEREMIQKALRKNNNKRKYAAQDLGISERTLYRKIKQYAI